MSKSPQFKFSRHSTANFKELRSTWLPCAVEINGSWRNFIIPIFMGDMKIIFWVKVTYIDVHWPPTSWVQGRKCHRDRASWWKFRGPQSGVKWVVHPLSRYLNFKNHDYFYNDDCDIYADDAKDSWGYFQFFHAKKFWGAHICGTLYEGWFSKMWDLPTGSSKSEFLLLSSICRPF